MTNSTDPRPPDPTMPDIAIPAPPRVDPLDDPVGTPPLAAHGGTPLVGSVPLPLPPPAGGVAASGAPASRLGPIAVPQATGPAAADPAAATGHYEPEPVAIPTGAQQEAHPVQIGLWGSPRSGKSTFLAALPLAAQAHGFRVHPTDENASTYMQDLVNKLVERNFPPPNRAAIPISWRFTGEVQRAGLLGRVREQVEFLLQLYDAPGDFVRQGVLDPTFMRVLASSRGLIYLLDPLYSIDEDPSFRDFFHALDAVYRELDRDGQLRPDGHLPHFLAVCVTKFDDESLFRRSVLTGLIEQDRKYPNMPRVVPRNAKAYFDWVCDNVLGPKAQLVRNAINAYFVPERVRYFASSAIGFKLNGNSIFDFRDFGNVEEVNGEARVRQAVRPVDIMEPLLFLEQGIRRDRRR